MPDLAAEKAVDDPRPCTSWARQAEAVVVAFAGYEAHERALDRAQCVASRADFGSWSEPRGKGKGVTRCAGLWHS